MEFVPPATPVSSPLVRMMRSFSFTSFKSRSWLENREIECLAVLVRDVVGDRINASIQRNATARRLLPGERVDRNVRAHPRHPQRRLPGLRQRDDGLHVHVVGGIHHRRCDGLVGAVEIAGVALADAHVRDLVFLRADDDLRHGLHHLGRMLAGGGLRRQHDGIGAVHDGVGDIRDFGAGRNGGGDHRFHHLRRHDHDAVLMAGLLHDLLLQARELGVAHFDAQIAARHHHAVARPHHVRQILDGLRALDLRDQQRVAPGGAQQLARLVHVGAVARKGHRQVIHLERGGDADVLAILVGQRAGRQSAALAVDALVVAELAADQHAGLDARALDGPGPAG